MLTPSATFFMGNLPFQHFSRASLHTGSITFQHRQEVLRSHVLYNKHTTLFNGWQTHHLLLQISDSEVHVLTHITSVVLQHSFVNIWSIGSVYDHSWSRVTGHTKTWSYEPLYWKGFWFLMSKTGKLILRSMNIKRSQTIIKRPLSSQLIKHRLKFNP